MARFTKHGHAANYITTPEYGIWCAAKSRCGHKGHPSYHYYGGRGITMCEAWRNSFDAFYADMGPRPSPELTLDRINNDGNYEPGNCRWATMAQQVRNRRNTVATTCFGETLTLPEIGRRYGVNHMSVAYRLKIGETADEAVRHFRRDLQNVDDSQIRVI